MDSYNDNDIAHKYLLKYKDLYEKKYEKKYDFNIENEFKESMIKYFDIDIYLIVMSSINTDYLQSEKNSELYFTLNKLKSDLVDIAEKGYFQKFYEEVSLEEKVRRDGFSFDVSIFKPLKRSVLFN